MAVPRAASATPGSTIAKTYSAFKPPPTAMIHMTALAATYTTDVTINPIHDRKSHPATRQVRAGMIPTTGPKRRQRSPK